MLRELDINEMNAVSGGQDEEDEVIATGTIIPDAPGAYEGYNLAGGYVDPAQISTYIDTSRPTPEPEPVDYCAAGAGIAGVGVEAACFATATLAIRDAGLAGSALIGFTCLIAGYTAGAGIEAEICN